jgi:hypothetical protein
MVPNVTRNHFSMERALSPIRPLTPQKKGTIEFLIRSLVCDALKRERSLMNQVEATTTLKQRYKMLLPTQSDCGELSQDLPEIILFTRKCQAKIAFRLQQHRDRVDAA